jgi:hypothetical protein
VTRDPAIGGGPSDAGRTLRCDAVNVSAPDGPRRRPFSLVLRLLPGPGADGRVVGTAELVETGESVTLQDVDDLRRLVVSVSRDESVTDPGEPRTGSS